MAKFQATGNYQISRPPQISGNIHNFLRYDQIAQAGAPQNLLGEAIYGIGSGIAQMFEDDFKPEKKEVKEEEKDDFVPTTNDPTPSTDDPTPFNPDTVEINTDLEDEEDEAELDKILNPPTVDNKIDEAPKKSQPTIVKEPEPTNDDSDKGEAILMDVGIPGAVMHGITLKGTNSTPEGFVSQKDTFSNAIKGVKSFASDFISGFKGSYQDANDKLLANFKQGKFTKQQRPAFINFQKTGKLDTSLLRLVDSGPLKRLKDSGADDKTANAILGTLQQFAYPYKNTEHDSPLRRVAHAANSPFLKTDSLKYREMRAMTYDPSKRGSIETAFQEAFNVQIDKFNYGQKVKADFEKEVGDEVGSLVVDVDNVDDQWKKSILDTSQRMKSQLYNDYVGYINGDIDKATYESKKLGYQAEINELSAANKKLKEGDKAFFENKHLIDPDASDKNVLDFFNTRQQAPENIQVRTAENGVKYYVGKTINGQDFQLPVKQIANGTSGMNLVMKANLAPDITKIVNGMKKIKEQEILKGGYAMANIPADDPRMQDFAKSQLMTVLNDENVLRSAAATYGDLNSVAYSETIKDGDDRQALREDLVDQIFNEVVKPQYVPERKQTVGTTRSGGGSMTAKEREMARIKANFDKMGNITEANYQSFLNQVPGFQGKYRAKIDDNVLLIADKKGNVTSKIDLSNPALAKSALANLAGVSGYRGQTYDAKSLIAQYSN
jgi:hypothetical protein